MQQLVRESLNETYPPARRFAATVCIPARNEADRIGRCLAALAVQRDRNGAPVVPGSFAVLLLVNNSTDATAQAARSMALQVPYPLEVLEITLECGATAGGARRHAMEEAFARVCARSPNGVLLTTDADRAVMPSWYAGN